MFEATPLREAINRIGSGVCLQRPPRLAEKTRSRSVIGYTSHINYANESRDAIGGDSAVTRTFFQLYKS